MPAERPEEFWIGDSTLAEGLVAGYFGQHPGSTHFHDGSAYGRHGTLTDFVDPNSSWQFFPELGWHGLYFNGDVSNNYVAAPSIPLANSGSVSFWFQRNGPQVDNYPYCISQIHSGGGATAWGMGGDIGLSNMRLVLADAAKATQVDISAASTDAIWEHWCGVWNGSSAYLYRDGMQVASDPAYTGPVDSGGADTSIGRLNTSDRYVEGSMADVVLHDRAITPAEIRILANRSDPMLGGLLQTRRKYYAVSSGAAPAVTVPEFMAAINSDYPNQQYPPRVVAVPYGETNASGLPK